MSEPLAQDMEPLDEEATIVRVSSDEQILATYEVMLELRPAIRREDYPETIRRMMQADGYRLAALFEGDTVRALAGYRFMEMLYCGKIMYLDDLNTDAHQRSRGHGKALMDWLKAEARANDCAELHLDTGVQRNRAHKFYFREGLFINCYHFRATL